MQSGAPDSTGAAGIPLFHRLIIPQQFLLRFRLPSAAPTTNPKVLSQLLIPAASGALLSHTHPAPLPLAFPTCQPGNHSPALVVEKQGLIIATAP